MEVKDTAGLSNKSSSFLSVEKDEEELVEESRTKVRFCLGQVVLKWTKNHHKKCQSSQNVQDHLILEELRDIKLFAEIHVVKIHLFFYF